MVLQNKNHFCFQNEQEQADSSTLFKYMNESGNMME